MLIANFILNLGLFPSWKPFACCTKMEKKRRKATQMTGALQEALST